MAVVGLKIIENTLEKGFATYFRIAGIHKNRRASGAHFRAMEATGVQMLNWILNGSSRESRVPPIATGNLRGSGSVFVENVLVHTSRSQFTAGAPATSYNAGKDMIAVGFNTAYATVMHEGTWVPGGKVPSKQARGNPGITADVGNKFIEKHLIADGKAAMGVYAMVFKRETGG